MADKAFIFYEGNRFELHIDGVLKAYTDGDHEAGKREMIQLAEEKGYTVIDKGEK